MLKKAFTLIELLVVIGIIGILVTIITASFVTAQRQARDSRRKTDIEQIRQALETYRSEYGYYPAKATWIDDLESGGYISAIPDDPKAGDGLQYGYNVYGSGNTKYTVCAYLENPPASPGSCPAADCGSQSCNYKTINP